MGCARSKEKQSDLDKNISKKNRHRQQQQQKQQQEVTPRLDRYESSIDIVVPETPMSPSSQETVDIRDDFRKSEQILNLSEALERSRRQREAFFKSLLSPPTSADSIHSNSVNCSSNEKPVQTTPVTTTSVLSRSSFQNNLIQEQVIAWLDKVNDCALQHKLNNSEFVMIQNHLVSLIDSMVNSIARLNYKTSRTNLLKIDYNEIKESIYYMRHSVQELPSLIEMSCKLANTNQSLSHYLNESSDVIDEITKIRFFKLIDQLNEINGKLPKEKFTCKCITVNDDKNDLSFDDLELIDRVNLRKEEEVVEPSYRRDPNVLLENLLNNLVIKTNESEEKEKIKVDLEENSTDDNEDKSSTPILTPASGQSTLPSEKTSSTPSSLSLESQGEDEEQFDIRLKLDESKSADQTNDSNNNNINQQILNQIVNEIFNETTAKENYTDESINNNSSTNENDQESEEADNVLTSNKVEANESDIQNENEIQVKLETNTINDKTKTTDQTNNKKQKPNNKKKRNKRR